MSDKTLGCLVFVALNIMLAFFVQAVIYTARQQYEQSTPASQPATQSAGVTIPNPLPVTQPDHAEYFVHGQWDYSRVVFVRNGFAGTLNHVRTESADGSYCLDFPDRLEVVTPIRVGGYEPFRTVIPAIGINLVWEEWCRRFDNICRGTTQPE